MSCRTRVTRPVEIETRASNDSDIESLARPPNGGDRLCDGRDLGQLGPRFRSDTAGHQHDHRVWRFWSWWLTVLPPDQPTQC